MDKQISVQQPPRFSFLMLIPTGHKQQVQGGQSKFNIVPKNYLCWEKKIKIKAKISEKRYILKIDKNKTKNTRKLIKLKGLKSLNISLTIYVLCY